MAITGIACTTEVVDFRIHHEAVPDAQADSEQSLGQTPDRASIAEASDGPTDAPVQLPDGISATSLATSRYVQYTCCESDKVSGCTGDVAGSPTSCKGLTFWKAYADDACRKQGLQLSDLGFYGDCTHPSDDGSVDAPCITLENLDSRCTICDDGTPNTAFYCESLVCEPLGDAGAGCRACAWADHPDAPCSYCSDAAGNVVEDSCHTLIRSS